MNTTYRIAALSPAERTNPTSTCSVCGREELTRPVKLEGPEGTLWAGTGCAAKLLGVTAATATNTAAAAQTEADQRADVEAERRTVYTLAAAQLAARDLAAAEITRARNAFNASPAEVKALGLR